MTDFSSESALAHDRRDFLKISASGALALGSVSSLSWLAGCGSDGPAPGLRVLRPADVLLIRTLAPAVIEGKLSASDGAALDATVESFDELLASVSDIAITLVQQAFDLLSFAPTRALVVGQWSSWSSASADDAQKALLRLRTSRFGLLNSIDGALVRLIASAWYLIPENARSTGYPGPPKRSISPLSPPGGAS